MRLITKSILFIVFISIILMAVESAFADELPDITSVAPPSATEHVEYTYNPTATDLDDPADTLTWSLTNEPAEMTIVPSTGAISWTPAEGITTSGTVILTVDDNNDGTDTEVFTISVTAVNEPPDITSTAPDTATEDVEYTYNPTATDYDIPADTLTWSFANEPSGMSINPSTGAISWTPGDVSTSGTVTLTVSDNKGGTATEVFTIAVTNVNDIPVIISTAGTVAQEDTEYMYIAEATDADPDDKLTWSLSNEPTGMKIKNPPSGFTAEITWTPAEGVETSGAVTLTVDDSKGGTDTEVFTISVTADNGPPEITSTAPTTATEDVEYTYGPIATDPDIPADTLTWSLSNEPSGMTIVASTGAISWTPAEGGVTTSGAVTLTVDDNKGGTDTEVFTIAVTADNEPPEITSSAPLTSTEDVEYTYSPTATDPDIPPDTLTWSLTNEPAGMTIVPSTGAISWTPGDLITSDEVKLTVDDNKGGVDTELFTITVTGINDQPEITSSAPLTAIEDVEYTYKPTVTDPDIPADTLAWSLNGAPLGMSFDTVTGAISWTPTESVTTSGPLTLAVDDGNGGIDTQSWTIDVTAVNDAPQITSEALETANTGVTYTYTATATDVDIPPDTLTWSLANEPAGMTIVPSTGVISWTPDEGIETSGEVALTVDDNQGGTDTEWFTIEVTDRPAVIIDQIVQITTTSVSVEASVVAAGIPAATEHGICWGESEELTVDDDCTTEGLISAVGPYTRELTGLTLGETYYVRAYAINDTGSGPEPVYSEVIAFQTHFPPKATLSETMAPLTNITTYSLQVGGIGVVSYKYRLDGGPWRDEQLVSQKIVENDLGEGPHSLQVVGKTESLSTGGIWQADQDATEISWVVDLTPPLAEIVNHPTGTVGPFGGDILVQGEDVVAYRYRLDMDSTEGTWSTVYPASVPIVLPILQNGSYTLAVVGADFAGNWQDESDASTIDWTVNALVPTALLTNLPEAVTQEMSVSIGVATPEGGISVEEYYYRFEDSDDWTLKDASEAISGSWDKEGEHTICVNAGSVDDTWQDGADGQSSLDSATCYTWRIDLTPAIVPGLTVENTEKHIKQEQFLPASKSIKLSWSWSSDDPADVITHYRVWYSLSEITQDTLGNAVELFCNIIPGKEGFVESMIVNGLDPDEEYHFAVSAVDLAGNESDLSVFDGFITPDTIPEIHTLDFIGQSGLTTDNSAADELLITGANLLGSVGGNLVRFESDATSFDLSSRPGTVNETSVDIPLGIPIGQYRVRIINKFGVSLSSIDRVVINEAPTPLPAVRLVDPLVIAAGESTWVTITGDNFSESPTEVNLLDAAGAQVLKILSDSFELGDNHYTIKAFVSVPENFPTGQYHIQVVNADAESNTVSAARLEIGLPLDLNAESGATTTSGILRLKDGLVPAYTFLSSDDGVQNGAPKRNVARIEITLEPGTVFEMQEEGEWVPHEEAILSPRMISPALYINRGIGSDIVAFSMGASKRLRLSGEARMFVALDVTLPSSIRAPVVYQAASDGSLTPASVDGAWRGAEVAVGGTILAERLNVPQTGVTTFTLGVLLDHMSEYVIGSEQGVVPLPEPDTMGASDEYGVCFIGAADATPRGGVHYVMGLIGLFAGAVFLIRKRYHRALTAFLLLIALTGFVFTVPTTLAAEGAAAEPSDDTEGAGIAIPGETETEQEALEVLKDTETGYVPAAASSVRKRARRDDGVRRWNIHAGLGYAYIGQEDTATYNGTEVKHELNGDLYPILGVSYAFSTRWALEFSLHRDFYSGEISNSLSGSSSKLEGITANLAALFVGGPYTWSWIGTYRPYGLAGFGYRTLDGDLDYPVTSYKPAIGAVLGIGMLKGKWDFRLGYSFFKHDADSTLEGYTGSGDELDTSGIYLEVAYHFLKF